VNSSKLKITFLDPSMYNLLPIWNEMKEREGVESQWAITREKPSFDKLKSMGVNNIVFDPSELKGEALNEFIKPLESDVIVSSTWGRADSLPNDIPKVQTFHALGNKIYFVKPDFAKKYDLLLFPSEFHKNLYIKYKVFSPDDSRLKVVGWHRIDCFARKERFNKIEICTKYGIDPKKPTIFYAPTWSVYGPHGIFYRWFDRQFNVFKELCEYTDKLGTNFIFKFHPLLQKPFMQNKDFWNAFVSLVSNYKHVKLIDAIKEEDPQPLLFVTDVLITDISSIFADYLPMNRPVVFIDPQLDIWEDTEICSSYRTGFVVQTPEDLFFAISDSLQNPYRYEHDRKRLFNKLVYRFDGNAAKRAVDVILTRYKK